MTDTVTLPAETLRDLGEAVDEIIQKMNEQFTVTSLTFEALYDDNVKVQVTWDGHSASVTLEAT